jgi:hypothetical protein
MVFAMVVIGGLTRLTESGLSIVEWQPISGVLPPFSEADWQALFAKYRESPQFRQVFPDLTLAGFKGIFWLEYIHRLWGRLIGGRLPRAVPLVLDRAGASPRDIGRRSCSLSPWARSRASVGMGDGGERPRRAALGQPLPPDHPSRTRHRISTSPLVDGAWASSSRAAISCSRGVTGAGRGWPTR